MPDPAGPAQDAAPGRGFMRLAVLSSVATLLLIAVGGAVRATDSGLACPTWPGCFSAGDFLPGLNLHVWLEHSHRLIAGVVGLLIAAQLVWALARYRHHRALVVASAVAAVAVVVQALLGALVVARLLRAELVTAHLGLGMAVLGCLLFLAVQARPLPAAGGRTDRRFARASLVVAGLTYVQILVGGHVTGVGAGLAYVEGFPFLGLASFTPLETEAQAYNVAHRILAAVLVVAVALLVRMSQRLDATGWTARLPRLAAGLVGAQVLIGVGNLWSGLSWATVVPHLAVASWIWAALVLQTMLAYRAVRAQPPGQPAEGPRTRALAESSL